VDDDQYTYDGQSLRCSNATRGSICDTALLYLNAPYLWGGRSPFGIDCSGLVQMVFRINGFRMKRDASMQAGQGSQVSFADSAEPGDIAFFENEEGIISHTGIVLHGKKIIHASGRVRIDDLDHEGIFNQELKKYTHKLRLIKTLL
jgi:cell wall-associated NlpC family hydrolase